AGAPRYRYHRPQGSPLAVIGRVLWGAWRNRRMPCPADASELHGFREAKVPHTDRLRYSSFFGLAVSLCVEYLRYYNSGVIWFSSTFF
uniref:Uncharacterized protein n=1 Tax=Aegilops tauschii subsp. strangulata TaxID=200361 RepID=A0A453C5I2_AEGTS